MNNPALKGEVSIVKKNGKEKFVWGNAIHDGYR